MMKKEFVKLVANGIEMSLILANFPVIASELTISNTKMISLTSEGGQQQDSKEIMTESESKDGVENESDFVLENISNQSEESEEDFGFYDGAIISYH